MGGASSAVKPADPPEGTAGEDGDEKATTPLYSQHFCGLERHLADDLPFFDFIFVNLEFPMDFDIFPDGFIVRYMGREDVRLQVVALPSAIILFI